MFVLSVYKRSSSRRVQHWSTENIQMREIIAEKRNLYVLANLCLCNPDFWSMTWWNSSSPKDNNVTNSEPQLCLDSLFSSSKPVLSDTSSPSPQLGPPEHIPLARVSSASRSYDLQERRRTGNMTGAEQAKYQRIPTDESEAQTLASADLDGIKSECRQNVTGQISVFY